MPATDLLPGYLLTETISVWRYQGVAAGGGSTAPRFSTTPETAPCRIERKSRRVSTADGIDVMSTHTISTNLNVGPMDQVSTSDDPRRRASLDVIRTKTPDGRGYTRVMM